MPKASIAQLVERLICNEMVGGSSPSRGSDQVFGVKLFGAPESKSDPRPRCGRDNVEKNRNWRFGRVVECT